MVRLTLPERRARSLLIVVGAVLTGACSAGGSVTAVPHDRSDARSVASALAGRAGCDNVEDYDTAGTPGTWVYSCQRGDQAYDIAVFASDGDKQAWASTHAGAVYLSEHSYVVVPASTPGSSAGPELLAPFAG